MRGLQCGHNLDICPATHLDRSQSGAVSITCSLSYRGNVAPVLQLRKNGHLFSDNEVTAFTNEAAYPQLSSVQITLLPAALLQLSPLSCHTVMDITQFWGDMTNRLASLNRSLSKFILKQNVW